MRIVYNILTWPSRTLSAYLEKLKSTPARPFAFCINLTFNVLIPFVAFLILFGFIIKNIELSQHLEQLSATSTLFLEQNGFIWKGLLIVLAITWAILVWNKLHLAFLVYIVFSSLSLFALALILLFKGYEFISLKWLIVFFLLFVNSVVDFLSALWFQFVLLFLTDLRYKL